MNNYIVSKIWGGMYTAKIYFLYQRETVENLY